MAPKPFADGGLGLGLLPALTDQGADQGTAVLARLPLQIPEAALSVLIQANGERHGTIRLSYK
jgi:hypothetical protein